MFHGEHYLRDTNMGFQKGNKVGHRFKPGDDPYRNLDGRPRGKTITERVRDLLEANPDRAAAIVEAGVKAAEGGDFQFWKYLCDRMEGVPAQQMNLNANVTHHVKVYEDGEAQPK